MVATTGDPASPVIIHSEERKKGCSLHFVVLQGDWGYVHGCQMGNSKLTGQGAHLFWQPVSAVCNCQRRRLSCQHHHPNPTVTNTYSHSVGARTLWYTWQWACRPTCQASGCHQGWPTASYNSVQCGYSSETPDQGHSTHSWKNQGWIRPVQRAMDSTEISSRNDTIMLAQLCSSPSNIHAVGGAEHRVSRQHNMPFKLSAKAISK